MTREPNEIEQALSRTVRSSLEKFQHNAEELHYAVNDLVAACSSARVANTLPPMMRAQILAASLAASLEALSRFVTSNLPSALAADSASSLGIEPAIHVAVDKPQPQTAEVPYEKSPEAGEAAPRASGDEIPAEEFSETGAESVPETVASLPAPELLLVQGATVGIQTEPAGSAEFTDFAAASPVADSLRGEDFPGGPDGFDVSALPAEVQELHRRANRVAKVSMQDIKLLRPDDVRLGQEHRDLCFRLRDDLERAHKEYDRRFQSILGHPVDYFYDWLVEILADGDPQLLGEYPYPSAVARR